MVSALSQVSSSLIVDAAARARTLADSQFRLVSGQKLVRATDDVGTSLAAINQQAALATYRQGQRNSTLTDTQLQLAEASLTRIDALLAQQEALATQATDARLSTQQRALIATQFSDLNDQIDAIADQTQFNGQRLLDGSLDGDGELRVTVGTQTVSIAIAASDSASLYANASISLGTATDAATAVTETTDARARLGDILASVTAGRTQLSDASQTLSAQIAGLTTSQDALLATDRPAELLQLTLATLAQQTELAVTAQAQQLNSSLLDVVNASFARLPPPQTAPESSSAATRTASTARTETSRSTSADSSSTS